MAIRIRTAPVSKKKMSPKMVNLAFFEHTIDSSRENSWTIHDHGPTQLQLPVPGCDRLDRRFVNDRICDCPNCADEDLFTCETCLPGAFGQGHFCVAEVEHLKFSSLRAEI